MQTYTDAIALMSTD